MDEKNCIFCKIAAKQVNSNIIYEDKNVVCFLDLHPVARGHCLVVPKKHYENVFDIDSEVLKSLAVAAKQVSAEIKSKLKAAGVNLLNASGKDAQQSVFHFHLHIVPRYENDGLNAWPESNYKETSFEELMVLLGRK
ncbi:MAG: HIT family protein [Candidatus Nanoarchaeia archaeon]